jgi:hypothetical protein
MEGAFGNAIAAGLQRELARIVIAYARYHAVGPSAGGYVDEVFRALIPPGT